jgi:uncharacterized protein (TIGR03435 family)
MTPAPMLALLLKVTIVMTLALAAARMSRRTRASVRHVLLAASFAVLLILPIASISMPAFTVAVPISTGQLPAPVVGVLDAPRTVSTSVAGAAAAAPAPSRAVPWLSIALAAWIGGAVLFLLPVIVGLWQVRSLRRGGLPWHEGDAIVRGVAASVGIRRPIDLLVHESLPGPMTCGIARPAIILPADAQTWSDDDLHRAVVHELEHVRRADWTTQCVARVIAACYWFHPIVWAAWRQLSLEAERACDDAVLLSTSLKAGLAEGTAYADQLVSLAGRLSTPSKAPQLAMANRHDLSTRVVAVLDARQPRGRAGVLWVGAAVAVAAVLATGMSSIQLVASQTPSMATAPAGPKPKYDTASIKPCEAEENPTGARGTAGGTNATWSPGRFYVPCVTTEQLIYLAYASYGAREDERLANDDPGTASNAIKVRGGPSWVHSLKDKYQIEATAQGATERSVLMGSMLQSLLEDRFHLKLHRDTEQMDLFTMNVAKSGFKLKPMKDGDCDASDVQPGPPVPGGTPHCGSLMMLGGGKGVTWTFGGFQLSSLASQLSRTLGVHVVDKTGITDKFVYTFTFARGEDVFATESSVRESLGEIGLTLDKAKGPRGFLVIDAIERPTPDGPFVFVPAPVRAQGSGKPRR